ncbi:MAG: hypothetical protein ACLT1J_13485 [Mediterraneibacter gnavus]
MKKLLVSLLALAMTTSLVACGGGKADAEKTGDNELEAELEYWSSWSETENQALALQEAAKRFTEENPGVKINFTFNGRDNRKFSRISSCSWY